MLKRGYIALALFLIAALAPWGLELLGVLAPSYEVSDRGFLLFSAALNVNPVPGQLAIAGYVVAVLTVMALLTFRASRARKSGREEAAGDPSVASEADRAERAGVAELDTAAVLLTHADGPF